MFTICIHSIIISFHQSIIWKRFHLQFWGRYSKNFNGLTFWSYNKLSSLSAKVKSWVEEIIVFFVCFTTLHFEKTFYTGCQWQYEVHTIFSPQLSPQFSISRHGRLYRWTENSFQFFLYLKPVEIWKKCFNIIWTSLKVV